MTDNDNNTTASPNLAVPGQGRRLRVILISTSNEFLWPRLPVAGELTIIEHGVNGEIIVATFRADDGTGQLGVSVGVPDVVFVNDTGKYTVQSSAVHAHVAEHHLAQAAEQHARRLRDQDHGVDMWGLTADQRIRLHLDFAGVHAQLAAARALGSLVVVTPDRQHRGADAERAAWSDQLTVGLAAPNHRRAEG